MDERESVSPIDDIAFLARSEHRIPALAALTVRPRSRSELVEITGVSSSTIRRTIRQFEERQWTQRSGYQYEATSLGASVATAVVDLVERLKKQQQLREVWGWLPTEHSGFSLDICVDATVTVAESDHPYRPMNRFLSLLDETEHLRIAGFDVAMLEPCRDELCSQIIEGMETEIINPPRVVDYIRTHCADSFSESLESGHLTIRLHDDLPKFAISLFDDRIAICCYDEDGVTVRVLIDTANPVAREWAESVYDTYLRETPTISLNQV